MRLGAIRDLECHQDSTFIPKIINLDDNFASVTSNFAAAISFFRWIAIQEFLFFSLHL
jgi:hypothetical protein